MKKWIVFFTVIVIAFPVMAADWEFSGSQRMATFWNHFDYGDFSVNGEGDDDNLTWDFQGNSRIEAKVKTEKVKGHIELGLRGTDGGDGEVRTRRAYGPWKFSDSGALTVGKDYSPIIQFTSGQVISNRIELQNIKARFPMPDFSGAYKRSGKWGYFRVGGMLRYIEWDDILEDQFDLHGSATGWGFNFTSNLIPGPNDVIRLGLIYGEGVENYMNDAPVDIGIQNNFSNPVSPIEGKPLTILGLTLFLDHTWNKRWTSSFGYSRTDIDNTDAQAPEAYKTGQYALGNLLFYPAPNVMVGGEFQWGRRDNYSDGFHSDGLKLQFLFKYNFSYKLGG